MKTTGIRRLKTMYCVIAGDIIESKEIVPDVREAVTRTAKDVLNHINTDYMDYILAGFGLVRGDAFEGVLLTQQQAPKIIQEIMKAFYRVEKTRVRISVVFGQLTTISSDRNEVDGPAFHKAFANINKMKEQKNNHWLQITFDTESIAQPLVDSLLMLLTALTASWTDRQREIVWAMEELSEQQNLVSKKLGISASVVNKQLKAANYDSYHQTWRNLEQYVNRLEESSITGQSKHEPGYAVYYSVAMRKNKQSHYKDALLLFYQSLDLAKKELGENDPQLVTVYNGLAETLIETESYEEAEKAITTALELQKALPKVRLEYAQTLNVMGKLKFNIDHIDEAMYIFEEAKGIVLNTAGEDHPFINVCNNNIAITYKRKKDYQNALVYYFKGLQFLKQHAEHGHKNLADVLYHIAFCYFEMGENKDAIHYATEALKLYRECLPSKHKNILDTEEILRSIEENKEEK